MSFMYDTAYEASMGMIAPTNTNKYRHVLRPLLHEEKTALRISLMKDGLLSELIIDQHGVLLEGHNRFDLCNELNIEPRYRQVTTHDPVNWIKGFQRARRNLSREEMRKLAEEQLEETPGLSNIAIGKLVGLSDKTVANVRENMIANGQIANAVRFEADGRLARGTRTAPNPETPDKIEEIVAPEPKKPAKKLVAPVEYKNGRFVGLAENIMFHFADDGHFHKMSNICKALDPNMKLRLTPSQIAPTLRNMGNRKDIHIDTKPAAKGQKLYRFYWQEKTIGLSVLKAKFGPVIEDLKQQANLPISHQSAGRFNAAAGMLITLLRELESE